MKGRKTTVDIILRLTERNEFYLIIFFFSYLGPNERGVMVIKAKDKTRAAQRKGALKNWKKTGKTIIKYLR